MPVPSPRNKILPARGNFTDLSTNVASLLDGEICYAIDQDQYYQNEGGTLVSVGATKAQGTLADSALQPGDEVVQSVAGRTGDVVLTSTDVGLENVDNTSDANKPISTATQSALDLKADLVGGVIPTSQIPAIAITEFLGSVANETEMLALTGQPGDWCLRTDVAVGYVIVGADPSVIAGWESFTVPGSAVTSINGQVGTVVLGAADVGAATSTQGALADTAVQRAGDTMTGALGVPVGSAVNPSVYFDANTGLYSPGTDQVAISTNGTGRLFIDASGNITATSPSLYVVSTLNTQIKAKFLQNSTSGPLLSLLNNDETGYFNVSVARSGAGGNATVQTGNDLAFMTGGSNERLRIDSSGRLLVGTSSTFGPYPDGLFVNASNGVTSSFGRFTNDVNSGHILLFKGRGGNPGTRGIVQNNDYLGIIDFMGDDGTDLSSYGARISAQVDGTPGTNDMPGRLVFSTTADGASSPTERMRIKSDGTINFSNVSVYADNTAALAGGLVAGDVYRKSDGTLMIAF